MFDHLELLHTRTYDARAYRDGEMLKVVGRVCDTKPAGLYTTDEHPLPIHEMNVVLDVDLATLVITDVEVVFDVHPHEMCVDIVDHYRKLVGLSVTRGFGRNVRDLFGGPKACTHTTALLQAMAPVVIQSLWSVRAADRRAVGLDPFDHKADEMAESMQSNINTCHVWAEESDHVIAMRAGADPELPLWIRSRKIP